MHHTTHDTALTPERLTQLSMMLREQQGFRREQLRSHADAPFPLSDVEAEVDAVLRRGALAALAEIDAALGRLAQGTYGRCTTCGEQISVERLEIIPQTARCVSCERAR
jgi:RNA polymerase-binding transcription factor DksA